MDDVLIASARGDFATVKKIITQPALNGEPWAQFNMGLLYDKGQGVLQDSVEAVKWYRLAANQGFSQSQYNLGVMYAKGLGVAQDNIEAVKWYRLAAQQGLSESQYNLGVMYAKGLGVVQDLIIAHSWLNLSAVNGDSQAITARDNLTKVMTPQEVAVAQKIARDCQSKKLKGCN